MDKEIEEENRRKKLLIRNTLGSGTLLSGIQSGGGLATFSGTSFTSGSGASGGSSPTSATLGSSSSSGPTAIRSFSGGPRQGSLLSRL